MGDGASCVCQMVVETTGRQCDCDGRLGGSSGCLGAALFSSRGMDCDTSRNYTGLLDREHCSRAALSKPAVI